MLFPCIPTPLKQCMLPPSRPRPIALAAEAPNLASHISVAAIHSYCFCFGILFVLTVLVMHDHGTCHLAVDSDMAASSIVGAEALSYLMTRG